jgi:phosphoglycolate phosphatase
MRLADYIARHHKTHLVFDFDATLVLLNVDWLELAQAMREDVLKLDAALWQQHEETRRLTPLFSSLVEQHGDKGLELLLHHVPRFELQHRLDYTKNDALLQEVAEFRAEYHLFIWSANSRELIEDILAQMGMSDWFDRIVGRNDVRRVKPSPEGFVLLRDPAVPLRQYLLIGDSSYDESAAQAAGIDFYKHDFFERGR